MESILEKLAVGETIYQLLGAYPWLSKEGILVALRCAAELLCADVVYPTAKHGTRTLT